MARKQPQALFEVYRTFKGIGLPGLEPDEESPPMEQGPSVAGDLPGRHALGLTGGQAFAALVLIVLALLAALWAGYTIGYGRLQSLDSHLPSSDEVRRGPVRSDVLSATGPATIEEDSIAYDPKAELAAKVAQKPQQGPREAEGGGSGEAGEGINPAISGPFRVRIMSLPVNHRDTQASLRQSRSFLRAQGIATVVESRGSSYYLYSKQTFPSDTHEQALALRDRIRGLGDQYARQVNRTNEFRSAYVVKRP